MGGKEREWKPKGRDANSDRMDAEMAALRVAYRAYLMTMRKPTEAYKMLAPQLVRKKQPAPTR